MPAKVDSKKCRYHQQQPQQQQQQQQQHAPLLWAIMRRSSGVCVCVWVCEWHVACVQAKQMRLKPHTSQVINYMQHTWQQRQQKQNSKSTNQGQGEGRGEKKTEKEKQKNGNTSLTWLYATRFRQRMSVYAHTYIWVCRDICQCLCESTFIVACKRYLSISVDNYDEHNKRNLWIYLHNQSKSNFVAV